MFLLIISHPKFGWWKEIFIGSCYSPCLFLLFFSKEINTLLSSTAVPPDVPESGPKSAHLCFKCGLLGKSLSSLGEIFHNSSHSRTETFASKNICLPRAGWISLTNSTVENATPTSSGPSRGGENSYQLGSGQRETIVKGPREMEFAVEFRAHLLRMQCVLCNWHTSFYLNCPWWHHEFHHHFTN